MTAVSSLLRWSISLLLVAGLVALVAGVVRGTEDVKRGSEICGSALSGAIDRSDSDCEDRIRKARRPVWALLLLSVGAFSAAGIIYRRQRRSRTC